MKKLMLAICAFMAAGVMGCSNIKKAPAVSLKLDPQKVEWFKDAKFGMFIHWGLYSILEGTYNGHTMPDTTFAEGNSFFRVIAMHPLPEQRSAMTGTVKPFFLQMPIIFSTSSSVSGRGIRTPSPT